MVNFHLLTVLLLYGLEKWVFYNFQQKIMINYKKVWEDFNWAFPTKPVVIEYFSVHLMFGYVNEQLLIRDEIDNC